MYEAFQYVVKAKKGEQHKSFCCIFDIKQIVYYFLLRVADVELAITYFANIITCFPKHTDNLIICKQVNMGLIQQTSFLICKVPFQQFLYHRNMHYIRYVRNYPAFLF